ncbi:uncharacterized protein LOC129793221 isoform X1 [Lutzomyia longipalpis]|uniref:uncharacterized protein LOC129793221 isoform X1 n=3 Tax=Lutzomyia longipalpis TaxID=7200 RepID=UPI002483737A|nr:uncharacterized protein LOC129793221 isoform X1 [Lutzomyia longipalpis]XP_055689021.1 uncharacterized protein LOC129793221 isoform X1 [Lutzomyia longipalpis]XP_055689022.1 uncharacterized protein LOC129793221 isoform X1 [Lutzomyia longipalpis]
MVSCGRRVGLLCVAIWSMAQSAGYLIASILGMRAFNCDVDMKTSQVNYFIYLLYFRQSSCGNETLDWDALEIWPAPEVEIPLPDTTEAVLRTQSIVTTYLILSILWLVASVMVVVAMFSPCMGRKTLKFFLYPWALVCIFVLIGDVTATYFHVWDIINTRNTVSLIDFLGIPYESEYYFYFNAIPPHIMILPALMMSLLSSRAVIGWFLNLSALIYVCVTIRKLSKKKQTPGVVEPQPFQPTNATTITTQHQGQAYQPQIATCPPFVQQQQPGSSQISQQQQGIYPSLSNFNEPGPSGTNKFG